MHVKDQGAGSGLRFEDRGRHTLKGVHDAWRLFAVAQGEPGTGWGGLNELWSAAPPRIAPKPSQ
jgi:hypothetical protein